MKIATKNFSFYLAASSALFFLAFSGCIHSPSRNAEGEERLAQLDEATGKSDEASGEVKVSENNQDLAGLVGSTSGDKPSEEKKAEDLTAVTGTGTETVNALAQADVAQMAKEAPPVLSAPEVQPDTTVPTTAPDTTIVPTETTETADRTTASSPEGTASVTLPEQSTKEATSAVAPTPTKRASTPKRHKSTPTNKTNTTSEAPTLSKPTGQLIFRHGQTMNRFYFVREGDTPEKLSRLFYGTINRADDIVKWNGPVDQWEVGKMFFYISPENSSESQLRSFYEERDVTPQFYTVKEGERLSNIAENEYHSRDSWREIAMVNAIGTQEVVAGQKLSLYPADLSNFAFGTDRPAATAPTIPPAVADTAIAPAAPLAPKIDDIRSPEVSKETVSTDSAIDLAAQPSDKKAGTEQERANKENLATAEVAKPANDLPWVALFAGVLTFFAVIYFLLLRKTGEDSIGTDNNDSL